MGSCSSKPKTKTVTPPKQTIDELVLQSAVGCVMAYMPEFNQTNIYQTNNIPNIQITNFKTMTYYPLYDTMAFSYQWKINTQSYSLQLNNSKTEVKFRKLNGGYKTIQCASLMNGKIYLVFVYNGTTRIVQMVLTNNAGLSLQTDLKSGIIDHDPLLVLPMLNGNNWTIVEFG